MDPIFSTCDIKDFEEKIDSLSVDELRHLVDNLNTNYYNSDEPFEFPDDRYDYIQSKLKICRGRCRNRNNSFY